MNKKIYRILKVILVISSPFLVLGYLLYYGLNFPPCQLGVRNLDIQEVMRESVIKFESDLIYYGKQDVDFREDFNPWEVCSRLLKIPVKSIILTHPRIAYPGEYKKSLITVDPTEEFRVVDHFIIKCNGIFYPGCLENGPPYPGPGGVYFLQNQSGDNFYIWYLDFEVDHKPIAGYYQNGVRIGDVIVEN